MSGRPPHYLNPLSDPADRAHYLSRVRAEAGRKGGTAGWTKKALMRPEDRPVPQPVRKPSGLTLINQIRFGPLRPWMRGYGLWLCQQSPLPGIDRRIAQVARLSKHKTTKRHVLALESRVDFQAWCDHLTADALQTAKAAYLDMLPLVTEVQRLALERALEDPANLKYVGRILDGATERFFPKKVPESDTKKVVHLHLSGAQASALAQAQQETVVEASDIEVVADPRPAELPPPPEAP